MDTEGGKYFFHLTSASPKHSSQYSAEWQYHSGTLEARWVAVNKRAGGGGGREYLALR
jgi:hypothetical protein